MDLALTLTVVWFCALCSALDDCVGERSNASVVHWCYDFRFHPDLWDRDMWSCRGMDGFDQHHSVVTDDIEKCC